MNNTNPNKNTNKPHKKHKHKQDADKQSPKEDVKRSDEVADKFKQKNIVSECNPANCYTTCKIADCPIAHYSTDAELDEQKFREVPEDVEIENPQSFAFVDFKGHRREIFLNYHELDLQIGNKVVVTAETGFDLGKVAFVKVSNEKIISKLYSKTVLKTIVRIATEEDLDKEYINQQEELEVLSRSNIIAKSFGLDMKVIDTEWQFDRHKVTIFFTAPSRVDFRELVKDLARQFKTRIELRQINTREEIKRIGCGLGCCGQPMCCVSFLTDFPKVTVEHAKLQQLSNNAAKLSGNCRRIKCCMTYEYDFYEKELKNFPPINSTITANDKLLKLNKIDVFKKEVTLYNLTDKVYDTIKYDAFGKLIKVAKVTVPVDDFVSKKRILDDVIIDDE
ncbi:MAG: hypothetical protein LBO69_09560 [Ignavibacteria bacterium]|jgi:cell fate regulator YaaT (PSP1 superfamily)|nr:hypothetical protein [Ignavibacteria bacterium]